MQAAAYQYGNVGSVQEQVGEAVARNCVVVCVCEMGMWQQCVINNRQAVSSRRQRNTMCSRC